MRARDVIDFLSQGESYGLPGARVERIETHCSIVFLIGEQAYKLKRPIAFSALDYTTIEKREAACRREVELNRRTAPELYLGVRAVRLGPDGRFTFEETGTVVDWVVAMQRFDQLSLFDRLAEDRHLGPGLARTLAEEIARFHAGAEPAPAFGGARGLRNAIEHNRRDLLTAASVFGEDVIERLSANSLAALDCLSPLLDRRRDSGHVRVCHGDLRLANICLHRGRPLLFDGIEFAEDLSSIDVLYDLAFLLMDLWRGGLRAEANVVFNAYLDATGDDEGLRALPLMMAIRAGTRAFSVAASSFRKRDPGEIRRLAAAARDLVALAFSLLEPIAPRVLALGGGSDAERRVGAADLAPSLRPAPGARIIASLDASGMKSLDAGYTVIDTQSFDAAAERQRIAALAAAQGFPFLGLWMSGGPPAAPPGWHVLDLGRGAAAIADVHRLLGAFAQSHDAADQPPPRRAADETHRKRG